MKWCHIANGKYFPKKHCHRKILSHFITNGKYFPEKHCQKENIFPLPYQWKMLSGHKDCVRTFDQSHKRTTTAYVCSDWSPFTYIWAYEHIWAYMSNEHIWAYGLGTKGLHLHSSVTYGAWCAVQMWHLWSHIWEYVLLCQVFKLTTDLKSSYDLRSKISWILKRNCMCVLACDDDFPL